MKKKPENSDGKKKTLKMNEIDVHIDSFGEIHTTIPIDQINAFLDLKVKDKKLSGNQKKQGN